MSSRRSFTSINEYLARPRQAGASLKRVYWFDRARREAGYPTLQAGHALFDYARQLDPDFPPQRALEVDLQGQLELKQQLERISRALRLR